MRISATDNESVFLVESDSGATYEIRYAGSGDADPDYVALWECNCPAGRHGRDCKHIRAFLASRLVDYHEYEGIPSSIEI